MRAKPSALYILSKVKSNLRFDFYSMVICFDESRGFSAPSNLEFFRKPWLRN
jgi:hypothetical protein